MNATERIDFVILTIVFGVLVGAISSFSILINQIVCKDAWFNSIPDIILDLVCMSSWTLNLAAF